MISDVIADPVFDRVFILLNTAYFVGIHQGGGDMDTQNLITEILSFVAPFKETRPTELP